MASLTCQGHGSSKRQRWDLNPGPTIAPVHRAATKRKEAWDHRKGGLSLGHKTSLWEAQISARSMAGRDWGPERSDNRSPPEDAGRSGGGGSLEGLRGRCQPMGSSVSPAPRRRGETEPVIGGGRGRPWEPGRLGRRLGLRTHSLVTEELAIRPNPGLMPR